MAATANRKMRSFKRWMKFQGIECSDALDLVLHTRDDSHTSSSSPGFSVSVRALCDFREGDVVARIPKRSCLTVKNSPARRLIEDAGLDGFLALAVAIMYERSLGPQSSWFEYLQLMPDSEPIPLLWSDPEVDSLLAGTELLKIIKEDKGLIYDDWKECIEPLLVSAPLDLNPQFFGIKEYFTAKSLIASRSFQIDDSHGFGMVPLADLFNHKTGDEDVHFTSLVPEVDSDWDGDSDLGDDDCEKLVNDEFSCQNSPAGNGPSFCSDYEGSSISDDDPTALEMIMVKEVKAGNEVFNTYGYLGNAALLHRYGFAEVDNPYCILNIDLELVKQWCSTLYSSRHIRRRLSLWRRLDYSGCVSQNTEYFEISFDGEPQVELLVLLYIMVLPEEGYIELELIISSTCESDGLRKPFSSGKVDVPFWKNLELNRNLLLTKSVRNGLLSLADIRGSLYGPSAIEDDIEALSKCCKIKQPKVYYSLLLRISERKILEKFRLYLTSGNSIESIVN